MMKAEDRLRIEVKNIWKTRKGTELLDLGVMDAAIDDLGLWDWDWDDTVIDEFFLVYEEMMFSKEFRRDEIWDLV
jgi:hypothetical protein